MDDETKQAIEHTFLFIGIFLYICLFFPFLIVWVWEWLGLADLSKGILESAFIAIPLMLILGFLYLVTDILILRQLAMAAINLLRNTIFAFILTLLFIFVIVVGINYVPLIGPYFMPGMVNELGVGPFAITLFIANFYTIAALRALRIIAF